jgi:hypothetical protein
MYVLLFNQMLSFLSFTFFNPLKMPTLVETGDGTVWSWGFNACIQPHLYFSLLKHFWESVIIAFFLNACSNDHHISFSSLF